MKRWVTALFIISSASLNASAQVPPTTTGYPLSTGSSTVPVVPTPTPQPTATPQPPVVGRNNGDSLESALPPGYPGAAGSSTVLEQPQRKLPEPAQPAVNQTMSRPNGTTPTGQALKLIEQPNTKSEIISVLPPVAKAVEIRAVLRTSVGDITIRLDRANAARTADYFVSLARGDIDFTDVKTSKPVKRPFYNGLVFHRVVKNTLIQTGDPFGTGRGGSGSTIPDELKPSMKFDRPGLVAMAPMREGTGTTLAKNSGSSQFFITLREMPEWNGQFTIFGIVEDGMDVVQKIANVKVGPTERPIKRIYLVAVDIIDSNK